MKTHIFIDHNIQKMKNFVCPYLIIIIPSLLFNFLGAVSRTCKMFGNRPVCRGKLPIFSTISCAAIFFFIIFTNSFISTLSFHLVVSKAKRSPAPLKNHEPKQPLKLVLIREELLLVHEEIQEEEVNDDQGHLLPPLNVTAEERILWLKKTLSKIELFKTNRLTGRFQGRVKKFFDGDCKVKLFMTWISPAKSFGRREFLALESVFKTNPRGWLVILSRTMDSKMGFRILKPLVNLGYRVDAITPDLPFLFKKTPAESWFNDIKNGKKDPGEIPLPQNLSNLVRLAVLYKYGGVYMDTDYIILKDLSCLRNSIGAQSIDLSGNWTRLNNAVLIFDRNHPLLYKCMEEFASTFDGNRWGHNGPYLVSRVVERVAMAPDFKFTVLQPMAFYPVTWIRISVFFMMPINNIQSKWVEAKLVQLSGETYGVHLWNRESSKSRIEQGSIMGRLISEHCVICNDIQSLTYLSTRNR